MTTAPTDKPDVTVLRIPRGDLPNPVDPAGASPIDDGIDDERPGQRTRWWIGALALALVAGLFYGVTVERLANAPPDTVPIQPIVTVPATAAPLSASGYVVAQRQASIASKGAGRLEHLRVTVGSRVTKGAVVARLQQDDVRALLRQARAQIDVAEASLANARTELQDAEMARTRAKILREQHYVSQTEFDTATVRVHRAEAAVRSALAAVTAANAEADNAGVALDNTIIRAPFDGTVIKKFAEVGEVVAPMASSAVSRGAVVLIADMTSLAVEAELSESSIRRVRERQPAEIVLDAAADRRYRAVVDQIVPTADRAKGTVLVKVRFAEPHPDVLPDMSAKVNFLTETPDRITAGKESR